MKTQRLATILEPWPPVSWPSCWVTSGSPLGKAPLPLNCLSICVESYPWVYLELKITLSLPGLGRHPATLLHCGWGLEADKRRKEFIKSWSLWLSAERDFSQRPRRETETKASKSPVGVYSRECCPEGLWLERRYSLFAQIAMTMTTISVNIIKLLVCASYSASYYMHFI